MDRFAEMWRGSGGADDEVGFGALFVAEAYASNARARL